MARIITKQMTLKGHQGVTERNKIVFRFDVTLMPKNEQPEETESKVVNILSVIKDLYNLTDYFDVQNDSSGSRRKSGNTLLEQCISYPSITLFFLL